MWMMSAYKISTLIDSQTAQSHLIGIRNGFSLITPMEDYNNKFCSVCFDFCDIIFQLLFTAKMVIQFINANKSDFNSFDVHNCSIIISEMGDPFIIQSSQGVRVTLVSVIMAVIVGSIYSFYGTTGEDLGIFGRCFKCKCFIFTGIRIRKCSLKIGDGQIIS